MALESTQPLTEMSTRCISWGKGGRCVRLTTLPPSCAVVMKSGNLNFLEPSVPLQACNGTALHGAADQKMVVYVASDLRVWDMIWKQLDEWKYSEISQLVQWLLLSWTTSSQFMIRPKISLYYISSPFPSPVYRHMTAHHRPQPRGVKNTWSFTYVPFYYI